MSPYYRYVHPSALPSTIYQVLRRLLRALFYKIPTRDFKIICFRQQIRSHTLFITTESVYIILLYKIWYNVRMNGYEITWFPALGLTLLLSNSTSQDTRSQRSNSDCRRDTIYSYHCHWGEEEQFWEPSVWTMTRASLIQTTAGEKRKDQEEKQACRWGNYI